MRLSSINLIANETEITTLDLQRPTATSQYVLKAAVGLDADEIVPRFYGFSKDGKKKFYDLKLKQKEIVLRIALNPRYKINESPSEVRDHMYKMVSASRNGQLELQFKAGATIVSRIYGHIVKMEVPYFSDMPELQITIRCQDPIFRGINPTILELDDIPPTNPLILTDTSSTAPHGFTMRILITTPITELTIQDREVDPEWEFKLVVGVAFEVDDVILFSSEYNNRYLTMVRDLLPYHLLDSITPDSVWPMMFPGGNSFYIPQIASIDIRSINFSAAYWGV